MKTKRHFLVLGVLLVCATGTAAYIFAVMNSNTVQAALSGLSSTPTAAVMLTPSRTPNLHTLSGIIRSLGQHMLVITVQHSDTTATVVVDNTTTYTSSRPPLTFAALKTGQSIEVTGRVIDAQGSRTVWALSITLLPYTILMRHSPT